MGIRENQYAYLLERYDCIFGADEMLGTSLSSDNSTEEMIGVETSGRCDGEEGSSNSAILQGVASEADACMANDDMDFVALDASALVPMASFSTRLRNVMRKQEIETVADLVAGELWHFQVAAIERLNADIRAKKSMKPGEIAEAAGRLHSMEGHAAQVFQLYGLVSQLGMRYDDDFSEARLSQERCDMAKRMDKYVSVRSGSYMALVDKVDMVKGLPLALADGDEVDGKDIRVAAGIGGVLGGIGGAALGGAVRANAARINPVNMRKAAKEKDEQRKAQLIDEIAVGNAVKDVERSQLDLLEQIDFMYNRADCMVLDGEQILFIETGGGEPGTVEG